MSSFLSQNKSPGTEEKFKEIAEAYEVHHHNQHNHYHDHPDHHHHKRCALTWEWQNVSWHKLMGQVLSDKKKRDVYDRFGEEGLKTNNGGGGGGGDQRLRHPHPHHHRWHIIHPTLHHNSHLQSHTVVTRSTGTRQKRSNNFSGLPTPSRASSTCLAWAPIHTRWSFLSSSAIFLHSYLFYLFFASLHILTSLYDYMYLFLARVSSTMATLMGWIRMILSQGGFILILPLGNCLHFHIFSEVRIDQIYVRS